MDKGYEICIRSLLSVSVIALIFWMAGCSRIEKETAETEAAFESVEEEWEEQTGPGYIRVEPEISDELLMNPGKGYIFMGWPDQEHEELLEEMVSVGYSRFNWCELEPAEGVYDWSPIDRFIDKYRSMGKSFAFGVMNVNTSISEMYVTPEWVFEAGAEGRLIDTGNGKQTIPNWRDEVFLEKLDAFIDALAERYDGDEDIEFIDIRSYGNWGEQHIYNLEDAGWDDLSADELKEYYIMPYIEAFESSLLVNPWGKAEYNKTYQWAVEQGVSLRRDGIMRFSDGSECALAYGSLPVVFEFAEDYLRLEEGGYWDIEVLEESLKRGRPSYMQFFPDMYASDPEYFKELGNRLGYHIWIDSLSYKEEMDRDAPKEIFLELTNDGLAPLYDETELRLALFDESGSDLLYDIGGYSFEYAEIAPGESIKRSMVPEIKKIPYGSYVLAVSMLSRGYDNVPDYRLANKDASEELWYMMGRCEIG